MVVNIFPDNILLVHWLTKRPDVYWLYYACLIKRMWQSICHRLQHKTQDRTKRIFSPQTKSQTIYIQRSICMYINCICYRPILTRTHSSNLSFTAKNPRSTYFVQASSFTVFQSFSDSIVRTSKKNLQKPTQSLDPQADGHDLQLLASECLGVQLQDFAFKRVVILMSWPMICCWRDPQSARAPMNSNLFLDFLTWC